MRAVDLIYAKREGCAAAAADIREFIKGYAAGRIPDYQASAFCMAVFFRGMEPDELAALTDAMMRSGEVFDWSGIDGHKADKHSTGGVGDKVSLILAPLAAACGLIVPMVSGRGLGHTGGTLDKLESIPGFNVHLSKKQIGALLRTIGVAMAGQTDRFVPADKRLYALRDVTATVESIPLIAASIMSKKLAEGCESLVLDIKTGNGAFMKTRKEARLLAETMIGIGRAMGRNVAAILTDMNQPTGRAVGNACEVVEAIECLKGNWPADLKEATLALTGKMLRLGGLARDAKDARKQMAWALDSGAALERFRQMIEAQGGNPRVIDKPAMLKLAPKQGVVQAPRAGVLAAFDTRAIGIASSELGAGRQTKDDKIDPSVAVFVEAKLGERVEKSQPVFTVHYRKEAAWGGARARLESAFAVAAAGSGPRIILQTIG